MLLAARTAAKLLLPLGPMLRTTSGSLVLSLMSDTAAIGVGGDVRDVLCVRNGECTIGFSRKHNHGALRHPRITEDFYKIIMKARLRTTTIEGFNMHGTLNAPYDGLRAMMHVPVIKMPARMLNAEFKENTKTTLILTFDGGWAISMRLHNKDKIARPTSLAWDVQLVGLPPSIYINTHSWDE